ncbi:MAG: DUF1073 domain-containing protein [Myxococcales bacterium FL481]|nr:MAG: DUF1073 domain-containing protein [Myxococcales bacterium FL481]
MVLRGETRAGAKTDELGVSSIARHWVAVSALETVAASLVKRAREGGVKNLQIAELAEIIEAEGGPAALSKRAEKLEYSAGPYNVMVTDKETESLAFIEPNLAYYHTNMGSLVDQVCASIGAPSTVVFGQSVGGLGTGEDENRRWRDRVKAYQHRTILPALWQMLEICIQCDDFPLSSLEDVEIRFASLEHRSAKDEAEIAIKWADGIFKLLQAGVVSVEQAQQLLERVRVL